MENQEKEMFPILAEITCPIRPLDFVRPKKDIDAVGMIKEVGSFKNTKGGITYKVSITWLGGSDLPTAWWQEDELLVIDNLARVLSKGLAHPFGDGKKYIDRSYPVCKKSN